MKSRKRLQGSLLVLVLTFLCVTQNTMAQDSYDLDQFENNNNNNNEEALIAPEQDVDYNTFRDQLTPYGNWVDYPGYGNVWVCNIPGFRPYYTGGHWAYTRFGWTWASDYNWGWAPFHYGRWAFDNAYGWLWVPGYTWGPAWVSWRTGGNYYGWAPLSPGLSIGINVGVGIPDNNWVFLPHRYMGNRRMNPYYINNRQNPVIIHNTTIINNTNVYGNNRYYTGPDRRDVERYSGHRIQQQEIYVNNQRANNRNNPNGVYLNRPERNNGVVSNNRQYNSRQTDNNIDNDIRQQPTSGRQSLQNSGSRILKPGSRIQADDNRNTGESNEQRQPVYRNRNDNAVREQQREQRSQEIQNRMQQQQNDQRRQQMEQLRQQQLDDRRMLMQQQQQNNQLRQQPMNDRRMQMQPRSNEQRAPAFQPPQPQFRQRVESGGSVSRPPRNDGGSIRRN